MGTGYFNKETKDAGTGYFTTPSTTTTPEPLSDKKWYDYLKPGGMFSRPADYTLPSGQDIAEMQQKAMIAVARPISAGENGLAWVVSHTNPAPMVARTTKLILDTKSGRGKEALETWKKNMKPQGLGDAIKRGWNMQGVSGAGEILASTVVPNEWIEAWRENVMSSDGVGKYILTGAEMASDIVLSSIVGMGWAKMRPRGSFTQAFRNAKNINTNDSFAKNAARTMKDYLNLSKDIPFTDEDIYKMAFNKKGMEAPELTPVRPNPELVDTLHKKQMSNMQTYMNHKRLADAAEQVYQNDVASQMARHEFYGVQDAAEYDLIYRGQPSEFKELQTVEGSNIEDNILFGKGVFTTSDEAVAKSYGENVFKFAKPKEKVFDLWNVSEDELKNLSLTNKEINDTMLRREIANDPNHPRHTPGFRAGYEQELSGTILNKQIPKELIRGKDVYESLILLRDKIYSPATNPNTRKIVYREISPDHRPNESLAEEVYNELINKGSSENLKTYHQYMADHITADTPGALYHVEAIIGANIRKDAKENAVKKLQELGYQWWKHKGGIRTGDSEHDVYVALSDEILQQAHRDALNAPPKFGKQITQEGIDKISQARAAESARLYQEDFQQTEVKLRRDFTQDQLNVSAEDMFRTQQDLTLAKMGRGFTTDTEAIKRNTRISYIEAYANQWDREVKIAYKKAIDKEVYESDLSTFKKSRQKGIERDIPEKPVYPGDGEKPFWWDVELPEHMQVPSGIKMEDMIKSLTKDISNGVTDDVKNLSGVQLKSLFDEVESFSKNRTMSIKLNYFERQFSPAFRVFERLGGTAVYRFIQHGADNSMVFNHDAKLEWGYHLKNMGLSLWKSYKADSSNPVLRRVWYYTDGFSPNSPHIYAERVAADGYALTKEELAFLKGVTDEAGASSKYVTSGQLDKELNAAQFISDKATELAELGIAQGKLYRPSDYLEGGKFFGQTPPEGAAPIRSNYITHLIDPLVNLAIKSKDVGYDMDDIARFFDIPGQAAKNVKIDQLKLRQGVREGLIENADHAFKTMLLNESNKFFMEPAYEGALRLSKMSNSAELSQYTEDWINYALRGIPTTAETRHFEPVARYIRKGWNSTAGEILHQAYWDEKDRAFKTLTNHYRRYVYSSAMGFNVGSALKNATQMLLTFPVIGTKSSVVGISSLGLKEGRETLKYSRMVLAKGINIHEIDISHFTAIESAGSWLFRVADQWWNTGGTFNGALYRSIHYDKKALEVLKRDYGYKEGNIKSFYKSVSEMLPTGDLRPHTDWADEIAKMTQYSYLPYDMPKALWTPAGKTFGQFFTWPMNYLGQYLPRLWDMGALGQGPTGTIPYHKGVGLIKHVVGMELIAQAADRLAGVDLGYISGTHALYKTGENIYKAARGENTTGEYVSSMVPSGPAPFYQVVVNGLIQDVIMRMASGKLPTFTNIRKGLIINPYPENKKQAIIDAAIAGANMVKPGIAPGNVIQKGEDIFVNKTKSPLSILGINKTEKKKSSGYYAP